MIQWCHLVTFIVKWSDALRGMWLGQESCCNQHQMVNLLWAAQILLLFSRLVYNPLTECSVCSTCCTSLTMRGGENLGETWKKWQSLSLNYLCVCVQVVGLFNSSLVFWIDLFLSVRLIEHDFICMLCVFCIVYYYTFYTCIYIYCLVGFFLMFLLLLFYLTIPDYIQILEKLKQVSNFIFSTVLL